MTLSPRFAFRLFDWKSCQQFATVFAPSREEAFDLAQSLFQAGQLPYTKRAFYVAR